MRFHVLVLAIIVVTLSSAPAFACKCVSPPPFRTAQELAQWTASGAEAIFEGKVESAEMKWPLVDKKGGDILPAEIEQDPPVMLVSFVLSRAYRGTQQKDIRLTTGLGGGDCGFDFRIGKHYLVYASRGQSGHLSTDICSGTALLEESQANLSYLRGEPVPSTSVETNKTRATGNLCGRVAKAGIDFSDSQVFLLPLEAKSPIPTDEASPARDGSFCVTDVNPAKYYVLFVNRAEDSPTSFVFFPSVAKSSEATPIAVKSGEANSKLLFKVPPQATFSVSGNVVVSSKSALPTECKVLLFNTDRLSSVLGYSQDVAGNGSFQFLRVLPGKYWAFVSVESNDASRWLTRKALVDVEWTVSNLQLGLIAE